MFKTDASGDRAHDCVFSKISLTKRPANAKGDGGYSPYCLPARETSSWLAATGPAAPRLGFPFALGIEADGFGVGEAFLLEDALGEGVGGVGGEDRDAFCRDDRAGVVGVVGVVDGAAGFGFAGSEDGLQWTWWPW